MILNNKQFFLFSFSSGTLLIQCLFMLLAFYFSKKFIELEKKKLKEESTFFDMGLVLIFALVISAIMSFVGTMIVSAGAKYVCKNPEYLYSSFFELLLVFSSLLLTVNALFSNPKEHLKIGGMSSADSQIFYKKFTRAIVVSMIIAVLSYASVNTFVGTRYCLISEYTSIAIIVAYCFLEICAARETINKVLHIKETEEPFVSEKVVEFLNKKFHYVMLFCMIYAVEITSQGYADDLSAFTHINNVYFFMLAIMTFQFVVVTVINMMASYINSLGGTGEYSKAFIQSRSKNMRWICDFTVFAMYFVAVCIALQYSGFDVTQYVFNAYFVTVVLGSFLTMMICRAFNEFRDSILEKANKGDNEHYLKIKTFAPTITLIFYILVIATAVLIICANLGINVVPIITSFSIFSAAFAFASQDVIKAFLNGLTLLMEKNLYVGDFVEVGGKSGTIEQLSVRAMYLRGVNGCKYVIPYHTITVITNYTQGSKIQQGVLRLFSLKDVEKASQILTEVVEKMKKEPAYENQLYGDVRIYGIGEFDLTGVKVKWEMTTHPSQIHFQDEVYKRLAERFRKAGIKVPELAENVSIS